MVRVSLIIPAYNEATRITSTLETVRDNLAKQGYNYEIIVVDDGSEDETAACVQQSFPDVRLISYRPNRGKGYAVKMGVLKASGNFRVYYDADASTPIEELEKLWPKFEAGADIVIGSRALANSRIERRQPRLRRVMGRGYNLLLRLLGLTRFPDTQCGFKAISAPAALTLFPLLTIDRFGFDAELLYLAAKRGYRIEQVPVCWSDSSESRVRLFSDSMRMLIDVLKIRIQSILGKYS